MVVCGGVGARAWLAAALACVIFLAAAPAAAAAPAWTEIASAPGPIVDVDGGRILFGESDQALAIMDRRSGAVTSLAVSGTRALEGFLSPHGAIFAAVSNTGTWHVYEWRDGSMVDVASNSQSGIQLKAAGSYAAYAYGSSANGPDQLFLRDLATGVSTPVAVNVQHGGPQRAFDVAANGDVVYWSGATIYRSRSGVTTQLSPDPDLVTGSGPFPAFPRTDGTNAVWRVFRNGPDPNAALDASGPSSPPKTPSRLDDFTSEYNPSLLPEAQYRASGGYIAYTKGRAGKETVWVRDPGGTETALSGPGNYDLFGLSPTGEVLYGARTGIGPDASAFLAHAGSAPVDVGPLPLGNQGGPGDGLYAFSLGGRWYTAIGRSLKRLSLGDAPTDGSETTITSAPQGDGNPASAELRFSSTSPGATFQCRLDSGDWSPCVSPVNYDGLLHGEHTFLVRAVETNGHVDPEPASQVWTVESAPPAPFALDAPADGAASPDATPDLSWELATDATSGIDHYTVYLRGAAVAIVHGNGYHVETPLPEGVSSWRVDAVDGAGNVRSSETRLYRVDTTPPTAVLDAPRRALTGDAIVFDASFSTDDRGGQIVRYQWDLNGDGTIDRDTGATSKTTASYPTPRDIEPSVTITDAAGHRSTASVPVSIRARPPEGPVGVSIDGGARFTDDPHVTLDLVWPEFARRALVSNDGGFGDAASFPVADAIPWVLDSTGPDRLPRTVYVRFLGAGSDAQTFQDDIVLDQTAPTVRSAKLAAGPFRPKLKEHTYHLRIDAHDDRSGVAKMQITTDRSRPGAVRRFRRTLDYAAATARIFVRVRDRAGNWSPWKRFAA